MAKCSIKVQRIKDEESYWISVKGRGHKTGCRWYVGHRNTPFGKTAPCKSMLFSLNLKSSVRAEGSFLSKTWFRFKESRKPNEAASE